MPSQTGPVTPQGKDIASRNAVRHGLTSDAPVIPGLEDPQDWHEHLHGIIDSLKPQDYHERILSERIALLLWKMRRATLYELAVVAAAHATAREEVQVAAAYARGTLAPGHARRHPARRA